MPYRNTVFANNEIYHIYNRSVAKTPIFSQAKDYQRFLDVVSYYRNKNIPLRYSYMQRLETEIKENLIKKLLKENLHLVEILAFCFMPNHFHFLLNQIKPNGITIFMRNVQNSYARYFNTKYERTGALFQALFKAVRMETTEQILHVSRYIHLNPVSSHLIKIEGLQNYEYSSFPDYLGTTNRDLVKIQFILGNFSSIDDYKKFVFDQAGYQQQLENIKHLLIEE